MEKLYDLDIKDKSASLEDFDNELVDMQIGIESDMTLLNGTFSNLEEMIGLVSKEDLKDEALVTSVNDAKIMVSTVNNYKMQLGLETSDADFHDVGGETINAIAVEDLKDTIVKVVDGIRRLFVKIVTRIKKFIIKLINNGDRLKKKLDTLKDEVLLATNLNKEDVLSEKHLKEINKMFATMTHLSDGQAFYTKNEIHSKDLFVKLIPYIAKYHPTLGYVNILESIVSGKITADDLDFNLSNLDSFESLDKLFMAKYIEDTGSTPKSVNTVAYYGNIIEGIIEVEEDGKTMLHWKKYSSIDSADTTKDAVSHLMAKENISDVIHSIDDPRDVLKKMNENGKTDVKAGDMLFKSIKGFEKLGSADRDMVEKVYRTAVNIIPNNVNANVINYFKNISNIVRFLEIQLSYKIKREQ